MRRHLAQGILIVAFAVLGFHIAEVFFGEAAEAPGAFWGAVIGALLAFGDLKAYRRPALDDSDGLEPTKGKP